MSNILANICLAVGLPIALLFAGIYLSQGKYQPVVWWFYGVLVIAGLGITLHIQAWLNEKEQQARTADARDAELRPYVGVSYVRATLEIGRPISILIKFTNSGKTPAENVEILQRFQKVPTGTPLNRNYTGEEFDKRSIASVNVGNTVETEIIGHEWTLAELMELTTDRTSQMFAHGVIRYRSKYIHGGSDETPFCYEFDPSTGQMIACRVEVAPSAIRPTANGTDVADALERARFSIEDRKIEMLEGGKRLRVEYAAVNRGRSAAHVTRTAEHLYIMPRLPQPPVFPPWEPAPEVVQVGQPIVIELVLHSITAEQARDFEARHAFLYVVGRIEYRDVFGKLHERGYVFAYDADTGTFYAPKDALGYNYET